MQECLISNFLGIITILDKNFLVVVEEISQFFLIENHEIYHINGVNFYSFEDSPNKKEIIAYMTNLKKVCLN